MGPNPFLGVVFHWVGGLAAASFYIPYRGVKDWAWETYWLVGGFFSWIVAPWLLAMWLVPDVAGILHRASGQTLLWAYFWGTMWGIGGLTFGLSVRYLGIALGYGIALGFCAAFGTLMPPLFAGELGQIAGETSGQVILLGIGVCVAGIGFSGLAGLSKEREVAQSDDQGGPIEFNFLKGILVATFAGIMSSAFSYGLAAGKPIGEAAKASLLAHGRSDLWSGLPVLVVVLLGGFTTNFIWCVFLNLKNKTGGQYLQADGPMAANYLFSALAGVTWYLQFFFYTMGSTRMGKYDFSSWTLHMASIIIFSTLWGVALQEWKGTSRRTHVLIGIGLAVLIGSTIVVGYGNALKRPDVRVEMVAPLQIDSDVKHRRVPRRQELGRAPRRSPESPTAGLPPADRDAKSLPAIRHHFRASGEHDSLGGWHRPQELASTGGQTQFGAHPVGRRPFAFAGIEPCEIRGADDRRAGLSAIIQVDDHNVAGYVLVAEIAQQ